MNLNDEMKTGKGNIAAQNSAQAIDAVSNLSYVFITVYLEPGLGSVVKVGCT